MPFVRDQDRVQDAYAELGLARTATDEEVRVAWRAAARATHPDTGGDPVAFRRAREAYEILTDPVLRAAHDRLLGARGASGRPATAASPFTVRPDAARPSGVRPDAARPSAARPDAARPSGAAAGQRRRPSLASVLLTVNLLVALSMANVVAVGGATTLIPRGLLPLFPVDIEPDLITLDAAWVPALLLVLSTLAATSLVAELAAPGSLRRPGVHVALRVAQVLVPAPLAVPTALFLVMVLVWIVLMVVYAVLWIVFAIVAFVGALLLLGLILR